MIIMQIIMITLFHFQHTLWRSHVAFVPGECNENLVGQGSDRETEEFCNAPSQVADYCQTLCTVIDFKYQLRTIPCFRSQIAAGKAALSIPQPIVTRWNSTFTMLRAVIDPVQNEYLFALL